MNYFKVKMKTVWGAEGHLAICYFMNGKNVIAKITKYDMDKFSTRFNGDWITCERASMVREWLVEQMEYLVKPLGFDGIQFTGKCFE